MSRISDDFLRDFAPWALRVMTFLVLFRATLGA
jgi:hypothetical protein